MDRPSYPSTASGKPNATLTTEWLDQLQGMNLIAGQLEPAAKRMDVIEPALNRPMGETAASGAETVEKAVAAAVKARSGWAAIPARKRGALVLEAVRRITAESEPLTILLARETGKAIRTECRGEITVALDILQMYGGLGSELKGETLPFDPAVFAATTREPLGVVAAILPWNVPLVLMALKIGPALVAGNTVVVKASEVAPYATLAVGRLLAELLPEGVFNVVVGTGPECGQALVDHPKVAKITFTGSEKVGVDIYRSAANRLVPVSLELGGKSPMIVCGDADLEKVVTGAVQAMRFTRQGQSCTAASRIFVHASIHDAFVARLREMLDALVIGDPLDEASDVGTIVSETQRDRVRSYVDLARCSEGTEVVECGTLPEAIEGGVQPDLFMRPTLILGIASDSAVVREEIFGPVTVIASWETLDEVLEEANDTEFGLAASIFTRDMGTAFEAAKRLDAGFVQVNAGYTIQPNLSYGGFGRSGLGKEASLEAMLEHFTRKKTIVFAQP